MFNTVWKCIKCGRPISIFYARDSPKFGQASNWVIFKGKCPKHKTIKDKLPLNKKESWMDDFIDGVLRCTKCEELGIISNLDYKGDFRIFKIRCPKHKKTQVKKISGSLFNFVKIHHEEGLTYKQIVQGNENDSI